LQTLGAYDALDDGPDLPARLGFLLAALYGVIRLTQSPADFAESSDNRVVNGIDAPSTVLKTVKLEGNYTSSSGG
jgi:hypothetical protein